MSAPTISKGYTFANGSTVTPTRLNDLGDDATLNFTQTDVVAGRSSSGAGPAEEIAMTAAGRAVAGAATAALQRTALGLGTCAVESTMPIAKGGTAATTAPLARVALNQGVTALTDASTVATNAALNNVFSLTIGGNRTLGTPTNLVAGATYLWIITQDGAGARTLAYDSVFKFPGGVAPDLSSAAGAIDLLSAYYTGSVLLCSMVRDFA